MAKDSLVESNQYFKTLLDLVPTAVYFDHSDNQKLAVHRSNQGQNPKQLRFDPDAPNTTSELQKIIPLLPEAYHSSDDDSNLDDDVEEDEVENGVEDDGSDRPKSGGKQHKRKPSAGFDGGQPAAKKLMVNENGIGNNSGSDEKSGDTSENDAAKSAENKQKLNPELLREKLRLRIANLQSKRQKGLTPEEFVESKRLRRKESKLKLKRKRKEAKKLKLSVEKQRKNTEAKTSGVSQVDSMETSTSSTGKMLFSKFQFSEQSKKRKDKEKKPKSFKELYAKVTKEKDELEELRKSDAQKAQKIAEKNAWRKAMEMSKGEKVKDNPELLKKGMKKEAKLKQRSQKKWQERQEIVTEAIQKKQEKRQKNIQARKQANKDRKLQLARKKGRLVSGF